VSTITYRSSAVTVEAMDIYAATDDLVVQLRADGANHWADAMNEEVESQRLRGLLWYGDRLVTVGDRRLLSGRDSYLL
jgi:hypothetical protein